MTRTFKVPVLLCCVEKQFLQTYFSFENDTILPKEEMKIILLIREGRSSLFPYLFKKKN